MSRKLGIIAVAIAAIAFAIASEAPAQAPGGSSQVDAYYARYNAPLWFPSGIPTPGANALPSILRRAQLDGLAEGPALAQQVEQAIAEVRTNPSTTMQMDRVVSAAWVRYVRLLERRMPGFEYADDWAAPRRESVLDILSRAAQPGQLQLILKMASVNPVYDNLRNALWNEIHMSGRAPTSTELANLARIRFLAPRGKYVIVDSSAARLYMMDEHGIADSMRIIVGKPETPTPLVVSVIYYATANPYWNVPDNLIRSLVAARVLARGKSYLKDHNYRVVTELSPDADEVSNDEVDWTAVAAGNSTIFVRQLPGPYNSMGKLKFGFANAEDVYLHDTPDKTLFDAQSRLLSNGCIRLEDAQRLARWLLGSDPAPQSDAPEQHLVLPQPVPIVLTYLTLKLDGETPTITADAYGWDPTGDASAPVAQ
ncbi:MAG TPA: L,D-transpeptidase family protein [Sphingomicrobium sp.]|nr:L,D-transpeptidase family protein [Sphingomicrobium sp.]